MQVHRFPRQTTPYALDLTPACDVNGQTVVSGIAHWSQGSRSPEQGMRCSAEHEFIYLVRGRLTVETPAGLQQVQAGDLVTFSPSVLHSAVALEDSDVYFVLINPLSEAAKAAQGEANRGTQ